MVTNNLVNLNPENENVIGAAKKCKKLMDIQDWISKCVTKVINNSINNPNQPVGYTNSSATQLGSNFIRSRMSNL